MTLQFLTTGDVRQIHEALTLDFAESEDPIFPPGLRDSGLLESAVGRQQVGYAGRLKYNTPALSAATVAWGVCNNHAFHNGNKRTAVVTLLVHLDKNNLVLGGTNHDELFKMILAVSQHCFAEIMLPEKTARKLGGRGDPDTEVRALAQWIAKRAQKPQRGERNIPYRQLRRILHRFGYEIEVSSGNAADIVQRIETRNWIGRPRVECKRIARIGYRDEGTSVSVKDLKAVRTACKLTADDGVDSATFYDDQASVDSFVVQYRSLLRRLARR